MRPDSTREIDKKYENVEDEGRGSHRYYVRRHEINSRRTWYAIAFIIIAIMLIVFLMALSHGRSYGEEWGDLIHLLFSYTPGKIKNA